MNDEEKYLFDLNGYIVIRGVFSTEEVASANAAIDNHSELVQERVSEVERNTEEGTLLAGDGVTGRRDLGGVLEWGDDSQTFRNVLAHPKLIPYFTTLLGKGYRMDHLPFCIIQDKGSEGFSLHGGMIDVSTGEYNPFLAYSCHNGKINNSLLACSVVLSDHNAGDGGFCVVRGSHKANFAAPPSMIIGENHCEFVVQPETKAGDVVLFSEATVHGAMPWTAEHQRRICLYRFAPATMAYGRSYFPEWPVKMMDGLTVAQKAVLAPPYAIRLDRQAPIINADGAVMVTAETRNPEKKAFDQRVFGTEYF
jgi:ectoine hydroxylase-related dioxygenase (phytanoyl-CoA dioxygenase family)